MWKNDLTHWCGVRVCGNAPRVLWLRTPSAGRRWHLFLPTPLSETHKEHRDWRCPSNYYYYYHHVQRWQSHTLVIEQGFSMPFNTTYRPRRKSAQWCQSINTIIITQKCRVWTRRHLFYCLFIPSSSLENVDLFGSDQWKNTSYNNMTKYELWPRDIHIRNMQYSTPSTELCTRICFF